MPGWSCGKHSGLLTQGSVVQTPSPATINYQRRFSVIQSFQKPVCLQLSRLVSQSEAFIALVVTTGKSSWHVSLLEKFKDFVGKIGNIKWSKTITNLIFCFIKRALLTSSNTIFCFIKIVHHETYIHNDLGDIHLFFRKAIR